MGNRKIAGHRTKGLFNLIRGPRMPGLGKTMVDVVLGAGVFEGVRPDWLAVLDRQFDIGGGGADVSGRGEVSTMWIL
jgi:hypothetical protein